MDEKYKQEIEIVEIVDKSWVMTYTEYDPESESSYEAQCKFELSSEEDAVIYDLEVPVEISNQGIGTNMIDMAERKIKDETNAKYIYAQIGARNGATKHVLSDKFGYEIINTEQRDNLGRVVDAQKKLE